MEICLVQSANQIQSHLTDATTQNRRALATNIFILITLFFTTLLLPRISNAKEKDTITWLSNHWPPYMIEKGDDKGQGEVDILMDIYIKNLSQFKHEKLTMNWKRFWIDIKKGRKVCNAAAYKNPAREEYALFSLPNIIAVPNSIIMKKEKAKKFINQNSYSLKKLIQRTDLNGGLQAQRSYSDVLDDLLKKFESGSNIKRRPFEAHKYLKLLFLDRIDYIIEYPVVVNYYSRKIFQYEKLKNFKKDAFVSIEIEEAPKTALAYIACPKDAWGKKVIGEIDKMLKKVRPTKEYLDALLFWASSKRVKDLKTKVYQQNFK